ncbi:MAG TPA: carboxypeptidase-like regulatory domain-containing protein [Acidimicrobiales bacterium]|nr:carboxypeptidase-like regulatory domain-containing protein [Acidimicrobiales bacterium]
MKRRGRRRSGFALVGGLLLAALAALFFVGDGDGGSGGGDGGPDLTDEQALVFGRVLDAKTKKPIAGAVVLIKQGDEPITATADKQGRYRAVVTVTSPFAFETRAKGYMGTAAGAVGGLCGRERFELNLSPVPAGTREAPPAPLFLSGKCPVR